MINYDVKFLTCDELIDSKNYDEKSFKYETKKRVEQSLFDAGKRNYYEHRGGHWRAPRPRQLKQLESNFREKTVVKSVWTSETLVTVIFSSGAIAYLTVKLSTLDITQILFDRYFVGKLSGQIVTNVALCKSHMLFTHTDRTASLVTFNKNNNCNLPCRITDRDPSLHSIELGGGKRRAERHLSSCETVTGSRILVWSVTAAEPAPWSPVIEDLANLHLYQVNGNNISLVAYHQLENETLSAELSYKQDNVIHIVEQISCQKNGISIEWHRYEIPASGRATKLSSKESGTRVSLPAEARAVRRACCDSRLLVACIDGSLHVVHQIAGLTHSTKAGFIATDIQWVGELIVAAEEGGRVQCFDRALSLLHHHTKCFDLAPYLRESRRMQILCSQGVKGGALILASFVSGPLTVLRITHPRLLTAWIRARRMSSAVALLKAMDWEREGTECLWAVNILLCAALRSGAEAVAEEWSAQAALGSYLAPAAPHGPAAMRFAPPLHDLARKFFHHLLRRGRTEKALSLAVDLSAWDLFSDARWACARRGQPDLAEEAASLALHIAQLHPPDSECSDSCTDCSSHSYSNSDAETSASSEIAKTKPPPLPRVSLPHTLLPVPVSQPEPISTNSIRPNLHQYLERDNTIWNTEIQQKTYKPELKPILTQNVKWHENGLPMPVGSTYKMKIDQNKTIIDLKPRLHDLNSAQYKHVFQTELREDTPNTLYRYQNNYPTLKDRVYRYDGDRQGMRTERNKVKFSDTVTINVVSQEQSSVPVPSRELADSLPLSPPHRYLAAFAPPPPPPVPGTTLDYVEV